MERPAVFPYSRIYTLRETARIPGFPESPGPASTRTTAPHLLPQRPPRPHHSPLALWHLFSLDAPTVAVLWTLFIAHCAGLTLRWPEPAAMFLAVWVIYAADRLLDARLPPTRRPAAHLLPDAAPPPIATPPPRPDLQARHRFHHQHRSVFLPLIVLSSLALAFLLLHIDARALRLYALLATLLVAYMLLIHARPLPGNLTARLPKELAVGLFFPAAVFIPTLVRTSPSPNALHLLGWTATWLRPTLLLPALLFACVCTLNCLYLSAWEHPAPHLKANHPTAALTTPSTTRWVAPHLTQLALFVLVLSTAVAATSLPHHLTPGLPALACALSTAALILLNLLRHRLSALHLRAAADLVLLTPLLLLPFSH